MNKNQIEHFECDWNSKDSQKIIEDVSQRIRNNKSEGHFVNDKRFEELKERMKVLLKKK